MLITLLMVMVSQMSTYVKIHQTVQLKYVQLIIFHLYANKAIKRYNATI